MQEAVELRGFQNPGVLDLVLVHACRDMQQCGLPRAGPSSCRPEFQVPWRGDFTRCFVMYNLGVARTYSLKKMLEILHQQIPMLAERYDVEKLEVFGSYVRAEQKKDSDLDILITFRKAPGLLTFIAVENYLSDLLGIKVDLVMKDSIKPKIGRHILREAILYE